MAAVDYAVDAMRAASSAIDLFEKLLSNSIPWAQYDETSATLDKFKDHYSSKASEVVASVSKALSDSKDQYDAATKLVLGWTQLASRMLPAYIEVLNNGGTSEMQKRVLLEVLSTGVAAMTAAQEKLQNSIKSFSNVAGQLTELQVILKNDFDRNSTYFNDQVKKVRAEAYGSAAVGAVFGPLGLLISYAVTAGITEGEIVPKLEAQFQTVLSEYSALQKTIDASLASVDTTVVALQVEIRVLGEMKSKIEETTVYVELDDLLMDTLTRAAEDLFSMCVKYQEAHGGAARRFQCMNTGPGKHCVFDPSAMSNIQPVPHAHCHSGSD